MKITRLAAVCVLAAPTICCAATALNDAAKRQLVSKYETSPILFVENRGQAPQGVDFVSSGLSRRVLTRSSGADIYVSGSKPNTVRTVSIGFDNANRAARGEAAEPTETRSGFLYNGRLVEGLVDYRKVKYQNVWPGIDVVYYGHGSELEYDFVLRPGADLSNVKLHFKGIDSQRVNADGDILLQVAGHEVIQHRPRIYQQAGVRRIEVTGRYHVSQNGGVTLETAKYDRSKTLVVDPVISYHNQSVDPTVMNANGIAVDSNGNVFITGETFGLGQDGQSSLYLLKLNSSGNRVGNTFEAGGTTAGNTIGNAVAVDGSGYVYVAGQTHTTGLFGCTTCGIQPAYKGGWDGFLLVFTSSFSLYYTTYLGGSGDDFATAVAASSPSAVYVTGYTASSDFPVSQGTLLGAQNAFLMKIDTTVGQGTTYAGLLLWGIYLGGGGTDFAYGLALDGSGNSYVVGTTTSTFASFRPAPSGGELGFNTTRSVNTDGYLAKIDSGGANNLYFTYFVDGQASSVATVGSTAYVAGNAGASLGNVTASAYQLSFGGGGSDAFLFRVDTSQSGINSLIYSTYLGGSGTDQASGVAADSNGHAYVVGFTNGSFPVKDAIQSEFGGGSEEPFYAVINTAGSGTSSLLSSTYLDRTEASEASAIALLGTTAYISAIGQGGKGEAYKISPGALQDFDQNNTPDLVWFSPTALQATVHYYGGTGGATYQTWAYLNRGVSAGYNLVGIADFDGNGVPDLVWQNQSSRAVIVDYYGGTGGATLLGWNYLDKTGVPGWHVAAVADFDGNGVPDLIWQSDSTGQVIVHYYGGAGGAVYQSFNWLERSNLSGWLVVGAADFDGNGVPDLVFQNTTSKEVVVHYFGGVGGATYQSYAILNNGVAGWSVVKTADFNGDGVPDLVWQNQSTNQVVVHYYGGANGSVYQSYNWLQQANVPGDWQAH